MVATIGEGKEVKMVGRYELVNRNDSGRRLVEKKLYDCGQK